MVTIWREAGLRIVIYVNDHHPAHVHVVGDGEAKINLLGPNGPYLIWTIDMTRADVRRALRIVTEQQAFFLNRWTQIHD
jgi:hypothetical protein